MTKLSVNVNKPALLRNSRAGNNPDPIRISRLALEAGAAGITVHPRPDHRHIRPEDVARLRAMLHEDAWRGCELNIEGNPFEGEWMRIVEQARPEQATLVPDTVEQSTSDHGFAMPDDLARLTPIVAQLHDWGCRVSVFMDPDAEQVAQVEHTGADRVELYTEAYAKAYATGDEGVWRPVWQAYADAAAAAGDAGLAVNAGHDLDLHNLGDFLRIPMIEEVSIGHALTAEALELGMAETVRRYVAICGD